MNTEKPIIFHNPQCSKSRETLQILEQNNLVPEIIEYLQNSPSRQLLAQIIAMPGITARELIRTNEPAYIDAKLDDSATDEQIIDAISKYPALLQRPIVISGNRAIIGRPPTRVLEIFDRKPG